MSTKHVVLGLMIERRGYGYELQQRIDERLGFLGLADNGVYGVLDRLEKDGLIAEVGRLPAGGTRRGSPRVLYAATEKGVEEFRQWMQTPCELAVVREDLHMKLVLAQPDDLGLLAEQVKAQELACLALLRGLTRPPLHELVDIAMPWAEVALLLVDDVRAKRLQSTIDWLQDVHAVMVRRLRAASDAGARAPEA